MLTNNWKQGHFFLGEIWKTTDFLNLSFKKNQAIVSQLEHIQVMLTVHRQLPGPTVWLPGPFGQIRPQGGGHEADLFVSAVWIFRKKYKQKLVQNMDEQKACQMIENLKLQEQQ